MHAETFSKPGGGPIETVVQVTATVLSTTLINSSHCVVLLTTASLQNICGNVAILAHVAPAATAVGSGGGINPYGTKTNVAIVANVAPAAGLITVVGSA